YIKETGVENVTLTGGEPLLQPDIAELIAMLAKSFFVEIETNGSIALKNVLDEAESQNVRERISFTMDYKLKSSGMEAFMDMENFMCLKRQDTVKFVVGSPADLERAEQVIDKYELTDRCHVYISPVFGAIEPSEIVDYMKEHKMNRVNMQLQMHKFIWNPEQRGV
ncbi:MAG: 4Fe-4S cluster-binding domain-containing protein, partial [Lachnospira sp.]|nr:4Fe-4S cluster-binding domain-containing protein [Lachnospira sp.]